MAVQTRTKERFQRYGKYLYILTQRAAQTSPTENSNIRWKCWTSHFKKKIVLN